MAGLIKKRDTYYAQFYDPTREPQRKRISLRTSNKREVRRRLIEAERAVEAGCDPWTANPLSWGERKAPRPHPSTLRAAREVFVARKEADGRSENTIRTYREVLSLLEGQAGPEMPLTELKSRDVDRFVRAPAISAATRYKRYGHVRTFIRWAISEGMLGMDPLEGVTPPDKPQKLPKAVTEAELRAICDAIKTDYEEKRGRKPIREGELVWRIPMFWFSYYTGLRASELARLRWEHVDFEGRLVYVLKQKNKKEQTIPLNAKARNVLETAGRKDRGYVFASPRDGGGGRSVRCFRENASRAFREARNRAGVRGAVSLHSLRHGFCTRLAEAGKAAPVIQAAARHADIATTMRYVHLANEVLKAELDDVFG